MNTERKITHKVVEFQGAEIGNRTLMQATDFDEAHTFVRDRLGPIVHWNLCPDYRDCADYFLADGRVVAVEACDRQPR